MRTLPGGCALRPLPPGRVGRGRGWVKHRSRHHRNAARVLPLAVGAGRRVWWPALMASQPSRWAWVGSANASANQVRVGSEKRASGSETGARVKVTLSLRGKAAKPCQETGSPPPRALAAADAAEVRVLERGDVLEAEARGAIHADVRDQHGAGEHERRRGDEEADAHESERKHQVVDGVVDDSPNPRSGGVARNREVWRE